MYKDLSLKEKAKVIREGVRLGLTSIDDILNLYDEAISYLKEGPIVTPYGLWKYPGKDTIIPSNNITMDNVNYPVLGISDAGDTKVMMPWNDYKFRGSMVYEHPLQEGGNIKPTFDLWYPTVPKQKNDTSSYDLRRAYNMLPFEEMEKFRTINDYHLPSVAYDEKTDTYTFLKRNGHPTLNYELDWYNSGSPDALEFREKYKLDTLSLPWRYIPRTYLKGGNTQNYLNVPDYNVALYNTVSPLGDFPNFWGALAYRRLVKDKLKNGNIYERDYKVGDTLGEKTAMAAWAKRLGIPYDEQDLPVYNGDTVTLPYSLVLEIPYDTNMLKNRIQLNKALLDKYSKYRYSDVVDAAIKADLYNLDKLRETYKTGKPVGLTEFGWNSRLLVNNGEIVPIENIQSPLNVLGNYNVRYSPEERRLYYSDEYDFNQFENFVPGEPYRIRGYIDLDNNKALGGNLFKKGGIYIKPENRGKFTALKKRTGHSASWFKAHGTPAQRKMATFALNSRHWKHDDGGHLFLENGQIFKRPLDDLTGRNILTSPILPPKSYYEQFTIPELEPKKPQPLQSLEGTYGSKYSELIPMSDGTYVNNPINKGLQQDWRTHTLEFAPFLAIGAGPAMGSTTAWLASKPALYNLGRMTLGSEIGGRSVDLASNLFTGNTWGLNVGNVVEDITGWNPNNTTIGQFVTDLTNPGYSIGLGKSIKLKKDIDPNRLFSYSEAEYIKPEDFPQVNIFKNQKPKLDVENYLQKHKQRIVDKYGEDAYNKIKLYTYNQDEKSIKKAIRDAIWDDTHNLIYALDNNFINLKYKELAKQPAFNIGRQAIVVNPELTKKIYPSVFELYGDDAALGLIKSHELEHAINWYRQMHPDQKATNGLFDLTKILKDSTKNYFEKQNNTELSARGSLIKDYFDSDIISGDLLRFAARNYVKDTGIDNDMTAFF